MTDVYKKILNILKRNITEEYELAAPPESIAAEVTSALEYAPEEIEEQTDVTESTLPDLELIRDRLDLVSRGLPALLEKLSDEAKEELYEALEAVYENDDQAPNHLRMAATTIRSLADKAEDLEAADLIEFLADAMDFVDETSELLLNRLLGEPEEAEEVEEDLGKMTQRQLQEMMAREKIIPIFTSAERWDTDMFCDELGKRGVPCAVLRRNGEYVVTIRRKDYVAKREEIDRAWDAMEEAGIVFPEGNYRSKLRNFPGKKWNHTHLLGKKKQEH